MWRLLEDGSRDEVNGSGTASLVVASEGGGAEGVRGAEGGGRNRNLERVASRV